jgi:hypothetical protein
MKLTIVFSVLGQHDMARLAVRCAAQNCTDAATKILIIDNGGDFTLPDLEEYRGRVTLFRPTSALESPEPKPCNIGVYPTFRCGMVNSDTEIVAFFHSDLMVIEKGFDVRMIWEFHSRPRLGLLGFVGSNEIDSNGGRGSGTTSNFQGHMYTDDRKVIEGQWQWNGTPAEAHGKRNEGYTEAAVVDGCVMVIRREAWDRIGFREDFPPHHFYDRLISTQMLEAGWRVGVLGVACDHLGGQTVSREQRYPDMAQAWCEARGIPMNENWDMTLYRQAEFMWLREYRDQKHLIPITV